RRSRQPATPLASKEKPSILAGSEAVILVASPAGLLDWILASRPFELLEDERIRVDAEAIGKQHCICQHIGEFVAHALFIGRARPLIALEKFTGLDRKALRQILGRVELGPVPLSNE